MSRRLPPNALVGAGLVVIGLVWYAGWSWWFSTRLWTPLDIPISLARGHFRTQGFPINVTASYLFYIEVRDEFDVEGGPCESGVRCPSALAMSWSLSERGRIVTGGENFPTGRVLGGFSVGPGLYTLDLDIRQDGSRLNAGAPHLVVFESGDVYSRVASRKAQALVLLLVSGAVGICLMILAAATEWQKIGDASTRNYPLTQPGSPPAPEPRPPARGRDSFVSLPRSPRGRDFGLSFFALCAAFIAVLTMLGMVVIKAMDGRSAQGFPVRLPKRGVVAMRLPGIQPVLVEIRLTEHRQRPEVYVNSQPVQWDDLDAVLRKQLSIRPPNWPVYLEGDPNMDFGWAAKAIDVIRGAHAEVMLVAGH